MIDETPVAADAGATPASDGGTTPPELPQDVIKDELDKIKQKGEGKTELERALHKKQELDKQIRKLRGETGEEIDDDDDKPVTVGMLKNIQKEQAQKTALQMADEISDEHERDLVKHYLSTKIIPSGNPNEDLKFARSAVNSIKNSQIAEELMRKGQPKTHNSGTSGPAPSEDEFKPTPEEAEFMRSFKLTKEDILKARQAEQSS